MSKQFPTPAAFNSKPRPAIALNAVKSNQVGAIGYDEATKTLAVSFSRGAGAIYHYPGVERKTYDDFLAAESIGTFFVKHIKLRPFEKYAPDAQTESA